MISRLQIRNFQKHDQLRIKIDPEITAIVGPSDTGKSSVIRALRWLVKNRPRGDGFIRDGESKVSVRLQVDDHTVERKRGSGRNLYLLDGNELEAFGNDVPEDVEKVLNLDDVNFQLQHESPFWFDLTPGEVAKRLNQIVDLGLIDEVMTNLAGRLRKSRAEEEVVRERFEEVKGEVARLCFVPALEGDISTLERLEEERSSQIAQEAVLRDLVGNLIVYGERIKTLSESTTEGLRVISRGEEWERLGSDLDSLGDLVSLVRERKEEVSQSIPTLKEMNRIHQRWDEWDEFQNQSEELEGLLTEISGTQEISEDLSADLESEREKMKEEVGDICPVCGGMMK